MQIYGALFYNLLVMLLFYIIINVIIHNYTKIIKLTMHYNFTYVINQILILIVSSMGLGLVVYSDNGAH